MNGLIPLPETNERPPRTILQRVKRPIRKWVLDQYSARARRLEISFVFINAPARSGTSLLTNVLCDHPEICGFGETKIRYESDRDFDTLAARAFFERRSLRMSERYVLEKIVHNQLIVNPAIFDMRDVRWICILRDPSRTLRSLMHYLHISADEALAYYKRRVLRIASDAERWSTPDNSCLITYESLTAASGDVLKSLAAFLGLETPLAASYRLSRTAFDSAVGDQSGMLRTGHIQSDGRDYEVSLTPDVVGIAREHYRDCVERLSPRFTVPDVVADSLGGIS